MGIDKSWWNSRSEIIEAAVKGFNPLIDLPRLIREAYPDFKNVEFGFFSESDVPEMKSYGWIFMTKEHFDVDSFNDSDIPSRFGLAEHGGSLKWRDNYMMIMGKDFREKLRTARHQKHEDQVDAAIAGQATVAPGDPRGAEMAEASYSRMESATVQPTSSAQPKKRGPGRPRKKK
jgi:hypothetical protein